MTAQKQIVQCQPSASKGALPILNFQSRNVGVWGDHTLIYRVTVSLCAQKRQLVELITHSQINLPLLLQAQTQEFLHCQIIPTFTSHFRPRHFPKKRKPGGPAHPVDEVCSVYRRFFINKTSHKATAMVYSSGKSNYELQCPHWCDLPRLPARISKVKQLVLSPTIPPILSYSHKLCKLPQVWNPCFHHSDHHTSLQQLLLSNNVQ